MKRKTWKYFAIMIAVILLVITSLSCHNPITFTPASNNDLINYKEFYLSADNVSLATKVSGTIYVRGDIEKPEDRRIQIVASMEIDSNDWGGIGFIPPPEWEITNIISDYPQGNPKPESYITTLRSEGRKEYDTMIIIGGTKYGAPEVQGGKGSIIIELALEDKEQELPETFKTIIGIGSKYDYIVHPVHETYEVPLNTDYHDVSPYYLPTPGSYLYDDQLNKSGVALKDVRTEAVTSDADYFNPSHPDAAVKKGETYLIVTGHVQNMDKENTEISLWAEGNDNFGNKVAWTLDAADVAGKIGLRLEYLEIDEFILHLNLPEDMITVRVYATVYPAATHTIPPPITVLPEGTLEGSQWKLITIKGTQLVPGSYISLFFGEETFWGSGGLNTYGGHYTVSDNGTLQLTDTMITLLGGAQDIIKQETEFIKYFHDTTSYLIKDNRLEIFDAATPEDCLVFERLPEYPGNFTELIGTTWQLVSLNGEPVPEELSITLNFDKTEASGTAGCFDYLLPYDMSLLNNSNYIRWGIISRRTGELPQELEIIAGRYTSMIALAANFWQTKDKLEIFTARGDVLEYKAISG